MHERVRLEKQRSVEEDWKTQEGLPKDQDFFSKKVSDAHIQQATSPEEAPLDMGRKQPLRLHLSSHMH